MRIKKAHKSFHAGSGVRCWVCALCEPVVWGCQTSVRGMGTWDGFVKSKAVANKEYTCLVLIFSKNFTSLHFDVLGTKVTIFLRTFPPKRVWHSVAHKPSSPLGVMEETLVCWPGCCSVVVGGHLPFISVSPGTKSGQLKVETALQGESVT